MFELMNELELEYGCILIRHYNVLLKLKENGTFESKHLSDLKAQFKYEQDEKFRQVCSHYPGFTPELVQKWVSEHAKHPKIIKQVEELDKLSCDVYEHMKVTSIPFVDKLPERLTRERYIRIYRKIFATLRHDLFKKIKEYLQSNRGVI
jgi:hypothetical protein